MTPGKVSAIQRELVQTSVGRSRPYDSDICACHHLLPTLRVPAKDLSNACKVEVMTEYLLDRVSRGIKEGTTQCWRWGSLTGWNYALRGSHAPPQPLANP